jgi:hypothetical protein
MKQERYIVGPALPPLGQSQGKPEMGIGSREWPSSAFTIVSVLLLVSVDNLRSNHHRRYVSGLSANLTLPG